MTKRILSGMLAIVTVVLCGSAIASAAEPVTPGALWFAQTYEDDSSSALNVTASNLNVNLVTGEDGNTYAEMTASTDKFLRRTDTTSPVTEDFAIMVDLCKMESPSLGWQFHVYTANKNQVRWAYNAANMEKGVWYTYLAIRNDGAIKHYRKVKGSDGAFEEITVSNSMQISDGASCLCVTFWPTYGAEGGATYETTKFLVDNLYFYNGASALPGTADIKVTEEGDTKKITASVDVISALKMEDSNTIAPVMVVFDKKGKIMEWSPSTVNVGAAKNTVSTEITMAADYYEKVKGGTAELYLWTSETSFKPMMNGYRVTLD